MDLPTIWFVIIAVLWTGYFVLEGFDFGVGTLLPVLGRDDTGRSDIDRRVMINAIGPVWDGNEVWVITAIGATFAAFPDWYASMLSGFYLPILVILLALIGRGVAFEYRGKVDDDRWRARWDLVIFWGSTLPAVVWGVIFANIVRGVELNAGHTVTSGLLELLNPYALLGGLTTLMLFTTHGAVFLSLKTDGEVRMSARRVVRRLALPTIGVVGTFMAWTQAAHGVGWTLPVALAVVAALAAGALLAGRGREGWSFAATALSIAALTVVLFGSLFPDVLPATDPARSLTIDNASAAPYALTVMTWVAVAFLPLVIGYQTWSYWVFRKRVTRAHIDPTPAYATSSPAANDAVT